MNQHRERMAEYELKSKQDKLTLSQLSKLPLLSRSIIISSTGRETSLSYGGTRTRRMGEFGGQTNGVETLQTNADKYTTDHVPSFIWVKWRNSYKLEPASYITPCHTSIKNLGQGCWSCYCCSDVLIFPFPWQLVINHWWLEWLLKVESAFDNCWSDYSSHLLWLGTQAWGIVY